MSRTTTFKEELELDQIREEEQQLSQRAKEYEANTRRIAQERIERECMMPPLDEILIRQRLKRHEANVSRGDLKNELRAQNRSLLMLFLLIAATCSLVWWGMRLMQGG